MEDVVFTIYLMAAAATLIAAAMAVRYLWRRLRHGRPTDATTG